jgi:GIY-YIG catalytic domain
LEESVDVALGQRLRLGSIKWGVYAFYDYDGEPIYVGQTKEMLGTRIRCHLTNQRTDAVAMSVLDPFEVHSIEVWPLADFQHRSAADAQAVAHLNALEYTVFHDLLARSEFHAVLNEKDPPLPTAKVQPPMSIRRTVVSLEVSKLRDHPDLRIARRAATLAKLAQVISARKVQRGLRRTLLAQAKRLQALAQRRLDHAADIAADDE